MALVTLGRLDLTAAPAPPSSPASSPLPSPATAPIQADRLLGGLAASFPHAQFERFHDDSRCPIQWPAETYLTVFPDGADAASTQWVRLVLVYPSTADRIAAQAGVRSGLEGGLRPESPLAFCRERLPLLAGGTLVVGRENAIVVMTVNERAELEVERVLLAAGTATTD